MKAFFEEYSGVIIVGVVVVALVTIVGLLMAEGGTVQNAFINMINTLLNKAGAPNVTSVFLPGLF